MFRHPDNRGDWKEFAAEDLDTEKRRGNTPQQTQAAVEGSDNWRASFPRIPFYYSLYGEFEEDFHADSMRLELRVCIVANIYTITRRKGRQVYFTFLKFVSSLYGFGLLFFNVWLWIFVEKLIYTVYFKVFTQSFPIQQLCLITTSIWFPNNKVLF